MLRVYRTQGMTTYAARVYRTTGMRARHKRCMAHVYRTACATAHEAVLIHGIVKQHASQGIMQRVYTTMHSCCPLNMFWQSLIVIDVPPPHGDNAWGVFDPAPLAMHDKTPVRTLPNSPGSYYKGPTKRVDLGALALNSMCVL